MLSTCIHHLKTQPPWLLFLSCTGFLTLLKLSISLLKWVFTTFLRPPRNLKKSFGSWAVVTGATDGIGKAFAYQLAGKGLNLILVSRGPNKLNTVSKEIQADFPNTHVKIVGFDFSGDIFAGVRLLEEAIKGLDVGILINNMGITYPAAMYFHEVDEKVWMNVVKVNLEGTTRVTKAVLPGMMQRKRGTIVNIGSGAAIVVPSHPLYTIYAATKAYIDQFSRSLHVEYMQYGIHVQCQVPLYVATKMVSKVAAIERTSTFTPSGHRQKIMQELLFAELGIKCDARPTGLTHFSTWCFARFLPDTVLDSWRLSIGIQRRGKITACMKSCFG